MVTDIFFPKLWIKPKKPGNNERKYFFFWGTFRPYYGNIDFFKIISIFCSPRSPEWVLNPSIGFSRILAVCAIPSFHCFRMFSDFTASFSYIFLRFSGFFFHKDDLYLHLSAWSASPACSHSFLLFPRLSSRAPHPHRCLQPIINLIFCPIFLEQQKSLGFSM